MVEWRVRRNPDTGFYEGTITVSLMPTQEQAVDVCRAARVADHLAVYGDLDNYRGTFRDTTAPTSPTTTSSTRRGGNAPGSKS